MKNPLNKRLPREFKSNLGRYLGIFSILFLTILIGSAFLSTMNNAIITVDNNESNCLIEDGQFETTTKIPEDVLASLNFNCDINIYDNFYKKIDNYNDTARILVFNEREYINLPSTFDGTLPSASDEICIERLFAQNNNIKIGDTITLDNMNFKITGIIAIPDYSSLLKNNTDLVMNTQDFGICIATKDGFERFNENSITYRYSYRHINRNLDDDKKDEISNSIQSLLLSHNIRFQNYLEADANQCISFLKTDIGKDAPVMKAFIYILIVIIAFIFTILTNNTIESESQIIGTLRASGYTKMEIIFHYLSPTIIIAVLSSILGNLLGYTVMIKPFESIYYTTYSIAPIENHFSIEAFITTTIVPVVLMIIINFIMLYNKLSLSPLKFLRKDLSKKKSKKAIKLPNISFIKRFRLRVLIQNKFSYLVLFFGIFLSSFLLMFGVGLGPLLNHYVDNIDSTLPYEYQYILKAPFESNEGEKLYSYTLKTWYEFSDMDISVTFMGISDSSEYFDDISLPNNPNEIVITKPLADKLDLEIGEQLTFTDEYTKKNYSLTVTDIYEFNSFMGAFMNNDNLNKLLNIPSGSYNSYISDKKLDIPDEYISTYITRSDLIGATEQLLQSFDVILKMVNIFSIIIYIIIMYILTKTIIEKNALSISFMKVFGYNHKEIGKLYLNATTITIFVSLLLCIPLEVLCFKYVLVYISSLIEGYIGFYLPISVYIFIVAIGIISYLLINQIHLNKIKKIPMSDALKNRE